MTGKKETGANWHPVTVVLREDIIRQARARKIDISDACNRALAGMTGIEYNQQQFGDSPVPPPVIIAKDGATPLVTSERKKLPAGNLHPVINADDPAAPARVVQVKPAVKKTPAEPVVPPAAPEPAVPGEKPALAPAVKKAAPRKGADSPGQKKSKGDVLKKFMGSLSRTDDAGDCMGKDELYELFVRFCHDHRIKPVPERRAVTVALKNQFAMTEKMVDGAACWTGIRLK